MDLLGIPYQVQSCAIDESPLLNEQPSEYVKRLAAAKAKAAAHVSPPQAFVLAADTTVAASNNGNPIILGKPENEEEARAILVQLRGNGHAVLTALALVHPIHGQIGEELCQTTVLMRHYSDEEISTYIASGDPFDKAGAYAIQHSGFHPVEKLNGCYPNVMGLPLCQVKRLLEKAGIAIPVNLPAICEREFSYSCPGLL